jgi:hypothetical protein
MASLFLMAISIACSQPSNTGEKTEPAKETPAPAPAPTPASAPAENSGGHGSSDKDKIPSEVKAAFPEAQSITMLHKDLTASHVSSIQKDYGVKLKEDDYHTYVAYSTGSGKKTQLGAATLVDVEGAGEPAKLLITYSNDIVIKKVSPLKGSGDVLSPAFLDQFSNKDHDQPFQLGKDIKYTGENRAAADAVTGAIKRDILSMQALYGKSHTH